MSRDSKFDALINEVRDCRLCDRMCGSARVLNRGCGPLTARVLVIGEAPGRLGADSSELPFHGDRAGHNFESLTEQVGLSRSSLFITNAALCNPKDSNGNNSTPTNQEVANCSSHLKNQIDLVQPEFIVTLGAVALRAIENIERHGLSISTSVRTANKWNGRTLVPLYHPGQRAMIHRSFANQLADYQFLAELVARSGKKKATNFGRATTETAHVALLLLEKFGRMSYFRLHKTFFLAECLFKRLHGRRMTSAYFVRQKDGPYCPELHPQRLSNSGLPITFSPGTGMVSFRTADPDLFTKGMDEAKVDDEIRSVIDIVFSKYSETTDAQLKTATYLTTPMRSILRMEQRGSNQFNAPIAI